MKILCSIVFLSFFAVTTPLCAQFPADALIDSAWQAWGKNDLPEVERLYRSALAAEPQNERACLGLTYFYLYQGFNDKAWNEFRAGLKYIKNPDPYLYALSMKLRLSDQIMENESGVFELFQSMIHNQKSDPSMRAGAMAAVGEYYQKKNNLKKSEEYYALMKSVQDWMVVGPFENISGSGYDKVFPPERAYEAESTIEGKNGVFIRWFAAKGSRRDRWVDFLRFFSFAQSIYYANTFVYSSEHRDIHLRVGTSGSVKVFLNDQLVISSPDENNNDLDTYCARVELQQGWNRLLVKCGYSEIDRCNMLIRLTDTLGNPLDVQYSTAKQTYPTGVQSTITPVQQFAEQYFSTQLIEHPNWYEHYLFLSDVYLHNDKAVEAELTLRSALERFPNCSVFLDNMLEAYARGEKYDEISKTIERLSHLVASLPSVLEFQINQHLQNEEFDSAEELLNQYSFAHFKTLRSYELWLDFYQKKQDGQNIMIIADSAYANYPHHWAFAYLVEMISFQVRRDPKKAIHIIEDYLEHDYSTTALIALAELYLNWSNLDQWRVNYDRALQLEPLSPGWYSKISDVYSGLQNFDESEKAINRALALCPYSPIYWQKLGLLLRAAKNKEKSIEAFRRSLAYDPSNYDVRESLRELEARPAVFSAFSTSDRTAIFLSSPTSKQYPNDPAVILLDDKKRVVYDRGASEYTREVIVKVFNQRGIDAFKEYQIDYNANNELLIVEKAVVVKKDGLEVRADVKDGHVVFKSLQENEFVSLKWRVKNYYSGRLSNRFWDTYAFNGYYPVKLARYAVLVPANDVIHYEVRNATVTPLINTTPEGTRYEWSLEHEPSISYEWGMPSLEDVQKVVQISSIPSWSEVVDWYLDLAVPKTRTTFEVTEATRRLFDGKNNPSQEEKIEMIYSFITENIRYSSVPFRQSGFVPQKARSVLVNRIGDCKDVATLCISMLKEVGIRAYFVLLRSKDEGWRIDSIPTIDFNHCIVAVETENGLRHLDLTAQNYPIGSLPEVVDGAFSLLIKPGVEKVGPLPRTGMIPSSLTRKSVVDVNKDRSITAHVQSVRTGSTCASMRAAYRNKGEEERKRFLIESLAQDFPNAEVLSLSASNIDTLSPTCEASYSFHVSGYLTPSGKLLSFHLPWTDTFKPSEALSYQKRSYPYWFFAGTDTIHEEITVNLPPQYTPVEPSVQFTTRCTNGEYSVNYHYAKGIISARRVFVPKELIVTPEQYAEFKKFYNSIIREDSRTILLKQRP